MGCLREAKGKKVIMCDEELLRRRDENKKYLLELENDNQYEVRGNYEVFGRANGETFSIDSSDGSDCSGKLIYYVDGSCFCVLLTGCWKFTFFLFHGKDIDSLYAWNGKE